MVRCIKLVKSFIRCQCEMMFLGLLLYLVLLEMEGSVVDKVLRKFLEGIGWDIRFMGRVVSLWVKRMVKRVVD
ncbi:hypothetical protein H5410_030801 [Solanum commersonii]|uniref:Uncharacterized protein n=1 Tax=Solanum commersonii TaxID=4109 RepID=A0A9J5YI01_SOLCO|nr:hypothetical protein H5410_030801 [Solanum commersonii]